jgi:hypothetical protein
MKQVGYEKVLKSQIFSNRIRLTEVMLILVVTTQVTNTINFQSTYLCIFECIFSTPAAIQDILF